MDFENIISWRYVFIYIYIYLYEKYVYIVYIYTGMGICMIIDLLVVNRTLWNPRIKRRQTSTNV